MAESDVFGGEFRQLNEAEFEEARITALRTFKVKLVTGVHETVIAHYHDAGQAGGCLSFVTIDRSGRSLITDTFNKYTWARVREHTSADQQEKFDQLRKAALTRRNRRVVGTGAVVMH